MEELGGRIPLILDAGACREGMESTIVRLRPRPKKPFIDVLRAGPVTKEMLRPFGKVVIIDQTMASEDGAAAEAPGQMDSHYAPLTPLLVPENPEAFKPEPGKRYALLSYRGEEKDGFVGRDIWEKVEILSPGSGKLSEAAVRFYALLRRLDALGVDAIVAEPLPAHGLGLALNDRLRRAARDV
jgi:L-threonylcarbamoyladenylate synthase